MGHYELVVQLQSAARDLGKVLEEAEQTGRERQFLDTAVRILGGLRSEAEPLNVSQNLKNQLEAAFNAAKSAQSIANPNGTEPEPPEPDGR